MTKAITIPVMLFGCMTLRSVVSMLVVDILVVLILGGVMFGLGIIVLVMFEDVRESREDLSDVPFSCPASSSPCVHSSSDKGWICTIISFSLVECDANPHIAASLEDILYINASLTHSSRKYQLNNIAHHSNKFAIEILTSFV